MLTGISALFQYLGFVVSYESGIDGVGRFDAIIEIFAEKKTVKICYDSPYAKGLPTILQIRETTPEGSYKESTTGKTYEDPYTLEMKELYSVVVEGKQIKTTAVDAREDLVIFGMILKAGVHSPNGAGCLPMVPRVVLTARGWQMESVERATNGHISLYSADL